MIWRSFQSEWVKMRRRRLWYGSYGAITGVVVLTNIVDDRLRAAPSGRPR